MEASLELNCDGSVSDLKIESSFFKAATLGIVKFLLFFILRIGCQIMSRLRTAVSWVGFTKP